MPSAPLAIDHRRLLERSVNRARIVAESGAGAALIANGFDEYGAPAKAKQDLSLVGQLVVRANQLGEGDAVRGRRALVEEIAYERWHRMLFSRFLVENDLLREPESGATVSLDDCEDIAQERADGSDQWSVAIEYAVDLLPGIFKPNIPATRVVMAREYRSELEALVVGMPTDVFTSGDGLGWVYQFWQARRKKEINDRVRSTGEKITGADIPPVTQLFTDDYIVRFLLENTLGAWWAARHPDSPILADMPYLRLENPSPSASETPPLPTSADASGEGLMSGAVLPGDESPGSETMSPTGQPGGDSTSATTASGNHVRDIVPEPDPFMVGSTATAASGNDVGDIVPEPDPFMVGSTPTPTPGHRRPAAGTFDGWATTTAGLRILDPCCGSGHFLTGAFDLLHRMRMEEDGLSAADAADAVLRDNLFGLELDRRCTQVAMFNLSMAAWKVGGHPERPQNWPQVACSGTAIRSDAAEWEGLTRGRDAWEAEFLRDVYRVFVDAPTLGSLIDLNALINANPYRMLPRNNRRLQVLLDRALKQVSRDDERPLFEVAAGEVAHAYDILDQRYDLTITNVPYLSRGSHDPALRAFADRWHKTSKSDLATMMLERCVRFGAEGGTVAAVTPQNWLFLGAYQKLRQEILVTSTLGLVARLGAGAFETVSGEVVNVVLVALSSTAPDPRATFIGLDASTGKEPADKVVILRDAVPLLLSQLAQAHNPDSRILLKTFGNDALLSDLAESRWGLRTGDRERLARRFWEIKRVSGGWKYFQGAFDAGLPHTGRSSVLLWEDGKGALADLAKQGVASLQGAEAWNRQGIATTLVGSLRATLYEGDIFDNNVAIIWPKSEQHLAAIWALCSSEELNILVRQVDQKLNVMNQTLLKVPFNLDHWQKVAAEKYPNGLPEPHSDDPTQWLFTGHPKGSEQPLHVALARLLGYRWPEQPDPTPNPTPSADGEGLSPADGLDAHTDPDGIVCLPPVAGEQPAHERLRALLAAAFGGDWSPDTQDRLLRQASLPAEPAPDLATWLRDDAFRQHVRLFHNRPFLWHVWDGRKDGFSAFVNYHSLDQARLDKLTYTYLGDWIQRQRADADANIAGAPARLTAALNLQRRLELIRDGEAPYDIYVRWKPLAQQAVGWQPDLNDGVRLNIRPFIEGDVLRVRFNVKWAKDRGANPDGSDVFRWSEAAQRVATPESRPAEINGKARVNDLHLTLATKWAARS